MITKFELFQASRNHVMQMTDIEAICKWLDIDKDELRLMLASIRDVRDPATNAEDRQNAYESGILDGFMLGVKAQCAEYVVLCERCGRGMMRRTGDDPVPHDYDPNEHHFICDVCRRAAQAAMN